MTYHFRKKILGSRISTYENLTTKLGKILRSFENRAPEVKKVWWMERKDIPTPPIMAESVSSTQIGTMLRKQTHTWTGGDT